MLNNFILNRNFLFTLLLIVIFLWIIHPKPFMIFPDQRAYSRAAFQISEGTFFKEPPTYIFYTRLGVTLPVSIVYKVFGVNSITTNLWSLAMSIITIICVWLVFPRGLERSLSTLLIALSVPLFIQTTTLLPDIFVTGFLMICSVLLYKKDLVLKTLFYRIMIPFLFMLILFWAFMAKMSAYWIIPLCLITFISDIMKKRKDLIAQFYIPCFVWAAFFMCCYLFLCYLIWGNPLVKLESLRDLSNNHWWSWNKRPISDLVRRMTYEPIIMLGKHYLPVFALSVGGLLMYFSRLKFWAIYYITVILIWWFGSTSISSYEPLPLTPRMILPVLPIMCIFGGYFVSGLISERNQKSKYLRRTLFALLLPVLIMTLSIIPQHSISSLEAVCFITLLCLLGIYYFIFIKYKLKKRLIFSIFLIELFCLPMINYVRIFSNIKIVEFQCIEKVKNILNQTDEQILLLCSDFRSPVSLEYYFAWKYPDKLNVLYFRDSDLRTVQLFNIILFFRHLNRSRSLKNYGIINFDTEMDSLSLKPFLVDHDVVQLMKVDKVKLVEYYKQAPKSLIN